MKAIDQIYELQDKAERGDIKPHMAYTQIYAIESALKEAKRSISDMAINELDEYTKGDEPVYLGLRPTVQSRATWIYSDDSEWERRKELLKQREKQMQKSYAMRNKGGFIDEHGEAIPPADKKESRYIKMEKS